MKKRRKSFGGKSAYYEIDVFTNTVAMHHDKDFWMHIKYGVTIPQFFTHLTFFFSSGPSLQALLRTVKPDVILDFLKGAALYRLL